LAETLDAGLAATGFESYDAFRAARSIGPRQTMRSFLENVGRWDTDGRAAALDTLDLSYLPPHLRDVEGAVLADYLRQVIDRVGYVIWQEIPDDPDLAAPYIHYRHPAGTIEIVPVTVPPPEGSDEPPGRAWKFSRDTLRSLPELYAATRTMAIADGLAPPEPLSRFFGTRLWFERNQPGLLERRLGLELWQWIAIAATAIGMVVAVVGVRWALVLVGRLPGLRWAPRFDLPLRLLALGGVLKLLITYAGLRTDLAQVIEALAILALIGGTTGLVFQLVGPMVSAMQALLQRRGVSDDIVAALVTGLLKFGVVLVGILIAADAMGLPYEGVIAGLGVGGIALAFAARETVANLIGAVILLSDRPFRQGDLIEAEGSMATVESVGLRSTRLRTLDDSLLIVPNSRLSENALNNWGRRRNRKLVLQIALTYDTPREKLDTFTARLRQIYYNHPRAADPLYLGMRGFGDSSIDIELWGYVRAPSYEDFVDAQHRLIGDIVDAAEELGVAFAFPTRTLHMSRPAAPVIAQDGEPRAEAG
jgi:small-conductance mechanosensitive channel